MNKDWAIEFFVTVVALVVGFVIGKLISVQMMNYKIPIAAGDPIPVPVDVKSADSTGPWSKLAKAVA